MTDMYPRLETGNAAPANPPRLLNVVRGKVRTLQYSRRTEMAYVHWIRDYTCVSMVSGIPGNGHGGNGSFLEL
jgi:hypothetical protein